MVARWSCAVSLWQGVLCFASFVLLGKAVDVALARPEINIREKLESMERCTNRSSMTCPQLDLASYMMKSAWPSSKSTVCSDPVQMLALLP